MRIVVGGVFARAPGLGGLAWVVLQYVLGLRRLGHQVTLVEPLAAAELAPRGAGLAASENAAYFDRVVAEFGLTGDAALRLAGDGATHGLPPDELDARLGRAELLVDLAGALDPAHDALVAAIPRRLYVDLDPGFTQLWDGAEGLDVRLAGHTHFATVGLTLERAGERLPSCGVEWLPTPPPVVLAEWPFAEELERDAWTTVGHWRGYGAVVANGVRYGQRVHSWRPLFDLPRRSGERFEVALAIDDAETADVAALADHGWRLLEPRTVAETPTAFRRFVSGSRGEIGIAKAGYVESGSGWFSDRSACYLAAGRPVVAQDTGYSEALPVGAGLLAFSTAEEAGEALAAVRRDYPAHRRAARRIAERHLDSDRVLTRLLAHAEAAS